MMSVAINNPFQLAAEIDRCQPWIQAALERSCADGRPTHSFLCVRQMILSNEAQLWSTENGCCVTILSTFPLRTIMQVWLLGGDFEEVFETHADNVERYARNNNCDVLFVTGRRGWVRRLEPHGYTEMGAVVARKL